MEYPSSKESIYTGGFSGLDPNSSEYFSGARLNANYLGQSMNPGTANQLGEVVKTIKSGTKNIEVQALGLQGDIDQAIPRQHFKEIRALMKLSGVKPSLHGPILDPTGITQNGLDEFERVAAENRFVDVLGKAHDLDDYGNIPVVFHASANYPGTLVYKKDKDGKLERDKDGNLVTEKGHAINRETGQRTKMEDEYKFRPEAPEALEKGKLFRADTHIGSINRTEWDNDLIKISEFVKQAREVAGNPEPFLGDYLNAAVIPTKEGLKFKDRTTGADLPDIKDPAQIEAYRGLQRADQFLENAELSFNSSFHKAFKYGTPKQQKELKKLSEDYKKTYMETRGLKEDKKTREMYSEMNEQAVIDASMVFAPLEKMRMIEDYAIRLQDITNPEKGIGSAPQLFTKVDQFAIEKAAETFGNVAFKSYKNNGKENSPIIALENIDPERGAITTGEQLRSVVEKTRENFEKQLVEKEKVSKSEAKKIAEKLVGATWDVGHLNQHKKFGWTDEDVVEQTKKIASLVKHVHLTDNFGFADSHLIPGMGNVPIKKHLEVLEKEGVLDRARQIVEGGGWAQMIQGSSTPASLTAFGSPIYGMKGNTYWNQAAGTHGSYFGGYGTINPQIHHSIYGAGLTTLPMELGGAIPGGGSRFSGNSMA